MINNHDNCQNEYIIPKWIYLCMSSLVFINLGCDLHSPLHDPQTSQLYWLGWLLPPRPTTIFTALVHFCLSSYNLKIETGYYTRPKTEICQRIYTYCDSHEVETETHFICKCTYFTDEKNWLYRKWSKIFPEIQNMNHENILTELLSSADTVQILAMVTFIHTWFNKRIFKVIRG